MWIVRNECVSSGILNLLTSSNMSHSQVPGGDNEGNYTWFFGIIGLIAAIVVVSLISARRLKYI